MAYRNTTNIKLVQIIQESIKLKNYFIYTNGI